MRILLLCYEYPPIGGGGGIGAQQYAEAWVASGHQVTVVTSGCPGLAAEEIVNDVSIIRVPTIGRNDRATSSFLSMLCYNVTGLLHVMLHRQELKEFDVINTHFSIPTGPMARVASRLLGLPNVLTIIGGDIYDPSKKSSPHRSAFFRLVNRWIINAADRVIAISSDTKKRAEQYYRVCRPIEVINYGFKPAVHTRENAIDFPVSPGKFYLIAVGRLVERKGFDVLVRAMKHLSEEVHLLLVGDGPLDAVLKTMASEMEVAQRVHMLGYKKREEIYSLLRKSHCFVLSSIHEGLGIVVQEAMDAGLPVVSTDNGGQVDLIKQGRNGLLVKIGDDKALADAIQAVYRDRTLAETMRRNNLADIRSLYIENNSKLYLELFREVTGQTEVQTVSGHKENGTELIGVGKQGV
jgi:glycosyltransferase involved in cell wall biosynthesis